MDLRTRTTLVCGALALAIAVSVLLRGRMKRAHVFFAAFAADVGFWYLAQTLSGLFEASIYKRAGVVLGVLMPVFACNLFEAMVPDEDPRRRRSRFGRLSLVLAVPALAIGLSPALEFLFARIVVFLYAVAVIALGLYELGQRGLHSRSRATQRRVRFLVITGALAGLFSLIDFVWVIGYEPAYYPAPVGVVLSVVFLFMLAQALRHERLLDLYEMLGRTLVATAVAFLIGFVFYVMVTLVGQFNTMWLNAIVVAIVVLVLFNPLRDWVEQHMQGLVFRERRKLEESIAAARRRLAHTLELDELGRVVVGALEQSRSVTTTALYVLLEDGATFEQLGALGTRAPKRLEVATSSALCEELRHGAVMLEQLARDAAAGRNPEPGHVSAESVIAAAQVLGELRRRALVIGIHSEAHELVGLLVVADERIEDAFSPEDVALLESLGAQIGVVIENSKLYARMKERDRLAVLGQMAAGLAHEIRNPLGAIKGAAQLLAEPGPARAAPDAASKEFLGIILEEVDRLDAVVGSVLDLAREDTPAVPPIDVNTVARRTIQVMSAEWNDETMQVDTDLADDLPRVAIAPDQLRQVMMNLLRNAAQAMKGRGTVQVSTRARASSQARGQPPPADGGWVVVRVRDEGPGIAPGQLKNIFLPFFTTKEEGTGLGLAICQRIVQTVGGRIDVRTREGEGTTFEVLLPARMEALGTPTPAPTAVPADEGNAPAAVGYASSRSPQA